MNADEPMKILLAEDEETDAFFARQAFAAIGLDEHLNVVKDGNEVMDFLRQKGAFTGAERPDLILLDIKMPGKDGHQTLQEIRAHKDFSIIPVIMLSSSTSPTDIKKSYENGANAHVAKSAGLKDMIAFVETLKSFWQTYVCYPDS